MCVFLVNNCVRALRQRTQRIHKQFRKNKTHAPICACAFYFHSEKLFWLRVVRWVTFSSTVYRLAIVNNDTDEYNLCGIWCENICCHAALYWNSSDGYHLSEFSLQALMNPHSWFKLSEGPPSWVTAAMPVKYCFFFFFSNVQHMILSYTAVLRGQTRLHTLF